MITLKWKREAEDLEGELGVEDGRRRWDLQPPFLLTIVALICLVIAGVRIYLSSRRLRSTPCLPYVRPRSPSRRLPARP